MVTRTGSYDSVIRGVSEQVPQDRRIGQHTEQINMISDPVRGNARRRGSRMIAEVFAKAYTQAEWDSMVADTAGHKTYSFQSFGEDHDLIYRTRASNGGNNSDFAMCFNKDSGRWIPVVLGSSAYLNAIISGGVSAVTAVGRYLFIAGNTTVTTTSGFDAHAETLLKQAAWVRGGGYSRTFTLKMTRQSGITTVHSYKTPSSSYPGTLDTSDIPVLIPDPANPGQQIANPEYNKLVNDRVNAYNGEVTKWIGTAAAAIVPAAIAEQLMQQIKTDYGWTTQIGRVDSTLLINSAGDADPVVEVACEDGGDGTLFRAVGSEITSIDMVSAVHFAGKVVRVRPKKNDGSDVFYLKAYPKLGVTNYGEVTWREAAGYVITPESFVAMATIHNGTMYIGGNATELATLSGTTVPGLVPSGVGDRTSSPQPAFFGKTIDYLGMFQDRLVVGAGAVVFFSRTGDYQNFFRQSILNLEDADPVEVYALGAEDDTIRAGTTYDRNLLLFGKRKQYVISGRVPLTPKSASIVVQSSHEDAVDAFPINSGNFVFYAKVRANTASVHQIQIGQLADTPESYEVSKQLDRYIRGRPLELVAVTAPNVLFLRTESQRDRFYVYAYLDTASGGERLFDSWSSWVTSPDIGALVGLSRHEGDIMAYYIRKTAEGITRVCDRFTLETDLGELPHLDSIRPYSSGSVTMTSSSPGIGSTAVVYDGTRDEFLLGSPWVRRQALLDEYGESGLQHGYNFPAYLTPTNPYILDSNGKAIMSGRLTISKFTVSVAQASGLLGEVETRLGNKVAIDWKGRIVGSSTNLIGRVPVVTTSLSLPVGREVRDFTYTLSAKTWLPLTVTAIEWTAQFFNNVRRG